MGNPDTNMSGSIFKTREVLKARFLPESILSRLDEHPGIALILITLGGIALMLTAQRGNFAIMQRSPSSPWTIATHLYRGKGYSACDTAYFPFCSNETQLTAMREPIPSLIFAAVMFADPSPMAGVLLEVALYIGVIYLLYGSLRQEGRVFALAAAALWAFSLPVVQEVGDGMGDLEAAFWVAAGIWAFQRARGSHRILHWMLAGVLIGLAALSRSVLLAALAGLVVGMLNDRSLGALRSRIRQALTLTVLTMLTLSPWIIRNEIVFGTPIIGSTLTGYNLFRQNYIAAEAGFHPHYVGAAEAEQALKTLVGNSGLSGRENEPQMQSFFMREGIRIITGHPIQYVQLVLFRFSALWFNSTVKAAYGERLDTHDTFMVIEQALLLAATVAGAWLHRGKLWPFILGAIPVCGAYLMITAQGRYLVEVMPIIAPLAASVLFREDTAH